MFYLFLGVVVCAFVAGAAVGVHNVAKVSKALADAQAEVAALKAKLP
jgi:hypothetical protein